MSKISFKKIAKNAGKGLKKAKPSLIRDQVKKTLGKQIVRQANGLIQDKISQM
jgi:hypothetical protein